MTQRNSTLLPWCIFGNIDLYLLMFQAQFDVTFESYETFPKQTFRNRINTIGSHGLMSFTIPVSHQNGKSVHELELSFETHWQHQLWQMLVSNYKKSTYFEYYEADIEALINHAPKQYLDFAKQTTSWVCKQFRHTQSLNTTSDFEKDTAPNDYREKFKASKFPQLLAQHPYHQVFSDRYAFQPNLNILDLIFNLGPQSGAYLQSCLPIKHINNHQTLNLNI